MKFTAATLLTLALASSSLAAEDLPKLRVGILKRSESCPRKAAVGDVVQVDYTGKLADGTVFDSSLNQGRQPIEFALGLGQVIPGWDKGILGMCIGEKRKLVIPPHLAYGDAGAGGVIPPKATLTFIAELKGIKGYGDEDTVAQEAEEEEEDEDDDDEEEDEEEEESTVEKNYEDAEPETAKEKIASEAAADEEIVEEPEEVEVKPAEIKKEKQAEKAEKVKETKAEPEPEVPEATKNAKAKTHVNDEF